ncbi:MAG: hypothetical protein L0226_14000 [Acidobacteria bacterium]|nr:hypothetical protein [Acidobacteriota bacterium]
MTKARLIKKKEIVEREQKKESSLPEEPQKKVVEKTVDAVVDWLESQSTQRQDPRKAFAALFVQPQTQ